MLIASARDSVNRSVPDAVISTGIEEAATFDDESCRRVCCMRIVAVTDKAPRACPLYSLNLHSG